MGISLKVLRVFDQKTLQVLTTATLYLVGLALLYFGWIALVAVAFGFFVAYLLQPLVVLIEARVWRSRLGATLASYGIAAVVLTAAVWALGARAISEGRKVTQAAPADWAQILHGRIPPQLMAQGGWIAGLEQSVIHWLQTHPSYLQSAQQELTRYTLIGVQVLFWAVVSLILGIFVLQYKEQWITQLTQEPCNSYDRGRVYRMLREMDAALGRYIWAQVLLSLIAFGVFALVLPLFHLPVPILLAALESLLEFVFVLGPLAAGIVILGAALGTGHNALLVLAFLLAWRMVQDYVITPILFGKRLEMNPVLVVIVSTIGWEIGGVIGIFLGVPAAALVQIAWEIWSVEGPPVQDLTEERKAA